MFLVACAGARKSEQSGDRVTASTSESSRHVSPEKKRRDRSTPREERNSRRRRGDRSRSRDRRVEEKGSDKKRARKRSSTPSLNDRPSAKDIEEQYLLANQKNPPSVHHNTKPKSAPAAVGLCPKACPGGLTPGSPPKAAPPGNDRARWGWGACSYRAGRWGLHAEDAAETGPLPEGGRVKGSAGDR